MTHRSIHTPSDPRKSSIIVAQDHYPSVHFNLLSAWSLVGPDSLIGNYKLGNSPSTRLELNIDTYPADGVSGTHYHPGKEHVLFVISGRATIWVGKEEREVGPFSWAWCPLNVSHGFKPANSQPVTMAVVSSHREDNPTDILATVIQGEGPSQPDSSVLSTKNIGTPEDPRKATNFIGKENFPGVHIGALQNWLLAGPNSMWGQYNLGNHSSKRLEFNLDTYPPTGISNLHYHPLKEQVLLVLSGEASITVADEERQVGPLSWAWCPPNVVHGFKVVGKENLTMAVISSYMLDDPTDIRSNTVQA